MKIKEWFNSLAWDGLGEVKANELKNGTYSEDEIN
jgi:hypothetical protein